MVSDTLNKYLAYNVWGDVGVGIHSNASALNLQERLLDPHRAATRQLSRDEVSEIVSGVIHSMEGDVRMANARIYAELDAIARYIKDAKIQIAHIKPVEHQVSNISTASDELDAVVAATEDASGSILDACEQIEAAVSELIGPGKDRVVDGVTRIYEACNFQDITGQRIAKVVRTLKHLKHLEDRIDQLMDVFGATRQFMNKKPSADAEAGDDMFEAMESGADNAMERKHLLNGPALTGAAIDQDEIDRLLSEF